MGTLSREIASHVGTPYGGISSPLPSNIAMSVFDEFRRRVGRRAGGKETGTTAKDSKCGDSVRCADNFVVFASATVAAPKHFRNQTAAISTRSDARVARQEINYAHRRGDPGLHRLSHPGIVGVQETVLACYIYPSKKALHLPYLGLKMGVGVVVVLAAAPVDVLLVAPRVAAEAARERPDARPVEVGRVVPDQVLTPMVYSDVADAQAITTATRSGAPAQRGRCDRILAQPHRDACLMRAGHLHWTLGA